jgi:hypothetical protein
MNCCKTHGTINAFVNELLGLLKRSVLPQLKTLLATEYEITITLKLWLVYNVIHPSSKGCMFFHGIHEKVN